MTQEWTSLSVPWSTEYLNTRFEIELTKAGPVVIVLTQVSVSFSCEKTLLLTSQLDDRYFQGLQGEYEFRLQFRLEKEGEEEYIVRNTPTYMMTRSVNTDIELDAGRCFVRVKVIAYRRNARSTEEVVRCYANTRREKLIQIGRSYDMAHAKAPDLLAERRKGVQCRLTAQPEQRGKASAVDQMGPEQNKEVSESEGKDEHNEPQEENKPPNEAKSNGEQTGDVANEERFDNRGTKDGPSQEQPPPPNHDGDNSETSSHHESGEPWNAVCVVGLKVYSKDPELRLRVVKQVEEAELDRDDPALSVKE